MTWVSNVGPCLIKAPKGSAFISMFFGSHSRGTCQAGRTLPWQGKGALGRNQALKHQSRPPIKGANFRPLKLHCGKQGSKFEATPDMKAEPWGPGVQTTIHTNGGANITIIVLLRIVILQIGSTFLFMGVEAYEPERRSRRTSPTTRCPSRPPLRARTSPGAPASCVRRRATTRCAGATRPTTGAPRDRSAGLARQTCTNRSGMSVRCAHVGMYVHIYIYIYRNMYIYMYICLFTYA